MLSTSLLMLLMTTLAGTEGYSYYGFTLPAVVAGFILLAPTICLTGARPHIELDYEHYFD